jgi:hypothetical protein
MTFPYRVPESAPDYEADDITDALRAAAERDATERRNAACADNGPANDVALQLAAEDAEAARIEADRVACSHCGIYSVATPGEWCNACRNEDGEDREAMAAEMRGDW